MGTKYRNLMEQIVAPENLRRAYQRARSGKRFSVGHLLFKEHAEVNLAQIADTILRSKYQVSPYTTFLIFEPKRREIMALPFYDRVIQHALVNVVGPIFERVFMPVSFACREGYGTHAAVVQAQATMRRLVREGDLYCLKMDFSKYFASIDRAILHREIRRKISCQATLRLIEAITPTVGTGLPIGNLTSQLWANLYGHVWDRWLVHTKGVDPMFRYMDDTIIFSHDQDYLKSLQKEAGSFIASEMKLKFSKWSIMPVSRGVPFLGYRIWPGYKLLKRDSVRRARRKIAAYRKHQNFEALNKFLPAWRGHASWANTHNLMTSLGVSLN